MGIIAQGYLTEIVKLALIWRFIVKKNKIKKYITRMGQKTGTLKQSKKVDRTAISVEITVCSLRNSTVIER